MACLWTHDEAGWRARELTSALNELGPRPALRPAKESGAAGGDGDGVAYAGADGFARLVRVDGAGSESWALIVSPGFAVRVNGRAPAAGLCVLADRDEIRVGAAEQYFFSTESLAAVEAFPGAERTMYCGRCSQRMEPGAPAVRCPGCGVWFHQSPDLPCWTYAQKCAFCDTGTSLDAGFTWIPEE